MPFSDWLQQLAQGWFDSHGMARRRAGRSPSFTRRRVRLRLEQLEDRITPTGPTLSALASFNGTNGANPEAGLIMDSSGNLYGTTYRGGASGEGTVFELAQGSGTITTMVSFNGTNGANPLASLVMDSSGNLYGTTDVGGTSDNGTVFEIVQGSDTITTLASFNSTDGANPYAGLLMDSNGDLYGTTLNGGASDDGTVFEVAKDSNTITITPACKLRTN
ncbi:MAG: choice-of-anchor tandem repeat GloVer-containing protein [Gemmataceae bacterium]